MEGALRCLADRANETLIGRAVAFVAAARALLIAYAREALDGMAVHDIDADW
jgi:hypothetical protein